MRRLLLLCLTLSQVTLLGLTLQGCGETVTPAPVDDSQKSNETCPDYDNPDRTGDYDGNRGEEISGLVRSSYDDDVLWAVNDGDHGRFLLAFDTKGKEIGEFKLPETTNTDWEDLARGFMSDGTPALVVADIGDNAKNRRSVQLYRVAEPAIDSDDRDLDEDLEGVERYDFIYADGNPHDAEASFIDPENGDLYVITKEGDLEARTRVYRASEPFDEIEDNILTLVLSDRISDELRGSVTSADISDNGDYILLEFQDEVRGFFRSPGQKIEQALRDFSCRGPLPGGQQEAIALAADGRSYYVVPEGDEPDVHYVEAD